MLRKTIEHFLRQPTCCNCHVGFTVSYGLCQQCMRTLPTKIQKVNQSNCQFVYPLWALMSYEGVGGAIVRDVKTRGDLWRAHCLATYLASSSDTVSIPDAVLAIPSTPSRQSKRGFNFAEVLAIEFSKKMGVPHLSGVLRRIDMGVQAHRTLQKRRSLLSQRFECTDFSLPQHILIVDDVHTSGGTLDAAAIALLNQPCRVSGVALTSCQL